MASVDAAEAKKKPQAKSTAAVSASGRPQSKRLKNPAHAGAKRKLPLTKSVAAAGGATAGVAATGATASATSSSPVVDNDLFLQAREAFRAGQVARLQYIAGEMDRQGHELKPYVDYWLLKIQWTQVSDTRVHEFSERQRGSFLADRLRQDWLRQLAREGRWNEVEAEYALVLQPELETRCFALRPKLLRRETQAVADFRALWLDKIDKSDFPDACVALAETAQTQGELSHELVWQRVRHLMEANRPGQARSILQAFAGLHSSQQTRLESAIERPSVLLSGVNAAQGRNDSDLLALAVERLARKEPQQAAEILERVDAFLLPSSRSWAWSQVAYFAALRHLNEAPRWFEKALNVEGVAGSVLSDEHRAWSVRSALRAHDWSAVRHFILKMPPQQAAEPAWVYWLGRSYKAGGRSSDAQALFRKIAGQPNFYGGLAEEELGRSIQAPAAASISEDEVRRAQSNASLRRALALFRLGQRFEATREWNWGLQGMSDRELLAAAEVARRQHIYDRAINTADKTREEHDYSLRYLSPFADQVRPAAANARVEDAFVYGLIRQESRFITDARSTVGASGLMQLMPATARWVAKKIGLNGYDHGRVNDPQTNILLGTSYIRMVLESLDNHPVLASAAYNAGPGRARKWQAERPLEGAIYAETIPFTETRDYVKKVLSNSVYYASLFNGQPQSLKARLGTINPRGGRGAPDLP